jgi:hypothetical protein
MQVSNDLSDQVRSVAIDRNEADRLTLLTLTFPAILQPSVFCSFILSSQPSSLHCSMPCGSLNDHPFRIYACRTSSQVLQHPLAGAEAP